MDRPGREADGLPPLRAASSGFRQLLVPVWVPSAGFVSVVPGAGVAGAGVAGVVAVPDGAVVVAGAVVLAVVSRSLILL